MVRMATAKVGKVGHAAQKHCKGGLGRRPGPQASTWCAASWPRLGRVAHEWGRWGMLRLASANLGQRLRMPHLHTGGACLTCTKGRVGHVASGRT